MVEVVHLFVCRRCVYVVVLYTSVPESHARFTRDCCSGSIASLMFGATDDMLQGPVLRSRSGTLEVGQKVGQSKSISGEGRMSLRPQVVIVPSSPMIEGASSSDW